MDKSYKLFCSQVSGKAPKLLSQDESTLLKAHSSHQQIFYQYLASLKITSPQQSLANFVPKYHGIVSLQQVPNIQHNQNVQDERTWEWLQHLKDRYQFRNPSNKFLVLENLVHAYKRPNVIDIKLGKKGLKTLKPKKQDFKDLFILNGCRMYLTHLSEQQSNQGEILFLSKYFFKALKTNQQITNHLGLYFSDGHTIRKDLLSNIIQRLRSLILSLKALRGWKFYSSSLCIFYDADDDRKFDLRLIDFGRSVYTGEDQIQQATIVGLENVHRLLMYVRETAGQIEDNLHHMKFKYLNQDIMSIPQHKIQEYEGCSSRQVSATFSPKKSRTQIDQDFPSSKTLPS